VAVSSAGPYANCVLHSRQITTPAPHHMMKMVHGAKMLEITVVQKAMSSTLKGPDGV